MQVKSEKYWHFICSGTQLDLVSAVVLLTWKIIIQVLRLAWMGPMFYHHKLITD